MPQNGVYAITPLAGSTQPEAARDTDTASGWTAPVATPAAQLKAMIVLHRTRIAPLHACQLAVKEAVNPAALAWL